MTRRDLFSGPSVEYDVISGKIDDVIVLAGRRPLREETVRELEASIKEHGLLTPITVRVKADVPAPEDLGVILASAWVLVTGRHRLEACRRLGWERIPIIVRDCDETEGEMLEIVENLHRADLTKEQRDRQIRRYAELLRQRKLQSGQSAPIESKREDGRGHRPEGVASKIAAETGLSKSTINRALADPKAKAKAGKLERKKPDPKLPPRTGWNSLSAQPEEVVVEHRGNISLHSFAKSMVDREWHVTYGHKKVKRRDTVRLAIERGRTETNYYLNADEARRLAASLVVFADKVEPAAKAESEAAPAHEPTGAEPEPEVEVIEAERVEVAMPGRMRAVASISDAEEVDDDPVDGELLAQLNALIEQGKTDETRFAEGRHHPCGVS
jgi:hypothetical protein